MRKLIVSRIVQGKVFPYRGEGDKMLENTHHLEVPDGKLSILVLKTSDATIDSMQEIGRQAQELLPGRSVVVLAVEPQDQVEFYQEE